MESLPLEIWHNIFSPFSLKEKMEFMSVCHSWWKFFDKYTLLSHVVIKDNYVQFTMFLDMLKRLPHRRLQIGTLELNSCIPPKYNKRTLCNIFSTARVLRVLNDRDNGSKRNLQRRHLKTMPSNTRIEFLSDSFHCELASQMLMYNICDRLAKLQLDFLGAIGVNGIFNQLKYAPVLQQLSLRLVYISLNDLEIIHQNTPSLKTLILEWVRVFHGDGYPSNIIPATCLTSLHFTAIDVANLDTHIEFYQYINQKYTNLKHVEHKDAKIYDYNRHDLKVLYYNGYLDFLKSIGRIQNRWYLNELRDDIDALDLDGDGLEYFSFIGMRTAELFQDLVRYNHVQDIRELTLSNTKANTSEVLKHMPTLTTLKLHFNGPNDPSLIDLTPYFNACPDSVKTFDIDCFQVVFHPSRIKTCYIENLSITCSEIISQYFTLIQDCLPSLLNLKLVGSLADRECLIFHREDPLEQATFILDTSYPVGFSYKGPDDSYHYYCSGDSIRLATWHDIQGLPMIDIASFRSRSVVVDDQNVIRLALN